ncbi:unnamed protein product [Coffea canephora]|uniref:UspA domain-containing protein n=2 Tax=Coffea TaxID=13442 RepID=A0A068TWG3_COFCA|nr:universal stress protein A-like protein [Coffea arabica]CDP00635.1 unnamed protein product [Coffea canephora]
MAVENGSSDKKVMVAIDENETSYHALVWYLQNFQESISKSSHPLILFMVQPPPPSNNTFAASLGSARMFCNVSPTPDYANAVQERNRLISSGILEKAKSICTSHGVNAETLLVVGDAKKAICDAVQKLNVDLLVLGDHGDGKLKRVFLGSVSNHCVFNAKCPVLVVKKPE